MWGRWWRSGKTEDGEGKEGKKEGGSDHVEYIEHKTAIASKQRFNFRDRDIFVSMANMGGTQGRRRNVGGGKKTGMLRNCVSWGHFGLVEP